MIQPNRPICIVLIYAILLSCFVISPAQEEQEAQISTTATVETKKGLIFRLREGVGKAVKSETRELARAEQLGAAQAEAIFRRLPEMPVETGDQNEFALRGASLPPPKTGKIIPIIFPAENPPNPPEAKNAAALEVMRAAPNGSVALVKDLRVTFSQPMVAVSSQAEVSKTLPVRLSPEIEGNWRWRGTNTLAFDAEPRFPMATRFTATIPAGTKSATGAVLERDFSWTFETPPARVEGFQPNDRTVGRDPVMLARFNQQIEPAAVLPKITAIAADNRKIALRLASEAEIAADREIFEAVEKLPAKSWIAFRAVEPLPLDSPVRINFATGVPSAEGTLVSVLPFDFAFRTYGDFKFAASGCGYNPENRECGHDDSWQIEFSNPIDARAFDKSMLKFEPSVENAEISVDENRIIVSGCCRINRETYKVTVSEKLRDVYGQNLDEAVSAKFRIADPEPQIHFEKTGESFVTLDPNIRKPVVAFYSQGYPDVRVKIFAVEPEDYETFYDFKSERWRFPTLTGVPAIGKLISDKKVGIKSKKNFYAGTKIDLAPALTNGFGHAIVQIEPSVLTKDNLDDRIFVWVEATQIGVDAFVDYENLTVYASDLKTGKPLKGVRLTSSEGAAGITAENGLGTLLLPAKAAMKPGWVIARNGSDAALLFEENYYSSRNSWLREIEPESFRWFVFDDRKMYRPGETVSIKGYLRRVTAGKISDVEAVGETARALEYVLKDSRGNEILEGKAALNAFGAFDFQFELPATLNLGEQQLELKTDGALAARSFSHRLQVQEFRRPEFEVTAKSETAAPFYVGDSATVRAEAKYYAGGGLIDAEANWKVTSTPTDYTPPNRDDFTFGKFVPWWRDWDESDSELTTTENFKGRTDANGRHFLAMDFASANPARPFLVNAEARVADVNRQAFAGSTALLVHPSELYVGIRAAKTFVKPGETFRVETITTDLDGRAVAGAPVAITAELKDWEQVKGEWQDVTVDTQACRITSGDAPAACEFQPKRGGRFIITARVLDRKQRPNESELTVWAAGGKSVPKREVEMEAIEMVPGKEMYEPGETAEILVNAPFFPAEGVLTIRRNGIVKTERVTLNEASTVLKIPVEERFVPNFHVHLDLFGAARRVVFDNETDDRLPKRPAFAGGALKIDVSTRSRELKVAADPIEKTLEPGGETFVNVAVTDGSGNPAANTEVALLAVDESVLALTNYRIADPVDAFYREIGSGVNDFYSRGSIMLARPEDLLESRSGIGFGVGMGSGSGDGNGYGDGDGDVPALKIPAKPFANLQIIANLQRPPSKSKNEIRMRRNFNALAIFSPSVKTGADGKARVKINLPDNLTRYRITAIASNGAKKFGKTESTLTARQSLMIRPSAPRFLNFGDRAELPVVLQNQTDQPLTVDVAIRAANARLTDGNGRRLTVAPNDRAEIRFPVTTEKTGIARFQIGAVSGNFADAAEFALPVWTPATTEAFATYGTTDADEPVVYPVAAPANVFPQFGGLEISTSSTQLQELTDAFIYLQSYPFECSEQVSSRILSVAALRDVLQAFNPKEVPAKEQIEAKMLSDIERLRSLQHKDGGFSFWSSTDRSIPFVSVHVAHALARARAKGYPVPFELTSGLLNHLKSIENRYPANYSAEARRAISAYALYVRDLMGDKDAVKARRLLQEAGIEKLSAESLAWLLSVLADDAESLAQTDEIKRNLSNRATETAGAAHFTTRYADGEYVLLASDRRTDGVILEALLKTDRENPLIPKIVRGLLANKVRGRWRNTQENAFILLALDKYFQVYEKVTPDFAARVWLGKTFAGEQAFKGRSTETRAVSVPMRYLQQTGAPQNLIIDRKGAGRLYYRVGIKYAPQDLRSEAADYGFKVTRVYEALDAAEDVAQNPDGSWTIRSGARVRVRLQMVAPTRRYHVALVDNLPAGLEIINSALATSESVPDDEMSGNPENYYSSLWYEHQNLRDNRAEAFQSLLSAGVWNYSYVARATTPGNFAVPPAKAEEMYSPETFGRSQTDFVTIR